MDENKKYYVYEHIRKDNGNVFYVGKGSGNRAWNPGRNSLHDDYEKKYGLIVRIVKDGLNEEEAYQEEYNTIMEYINSGYGIDIDGLHGNDPDKFLTNKTFGSRGSIGISNPMFEVSPKERMSCEKYEEWLDKTRKRLNNQIGENNPNWGNDTLHNKIKDNPELRIQYYSRPGNQNGRARGISMYDLDGNFIKSFDYIGLCAEYIKENYRPNTSLNGIRQRIITSITNNSHAYRFKFKYN